MKAAVLKTNKKIVIEEIPISDPNPNECQISIKAAGVCSSDIQRSFKKGAYSYPLVMGHEFSGEVIKLGEDVTDFAKGDRVAVYPLLPCFKCEACNQKIYAQCKEYDYFGSRRNGAFCQFLNINTWNLVKIPKEVSFKNAAASEPLSVGIHALKRGDFFNNPPKNLVIIGAGFIGILTAMIASKLSSDTEITIIDRNQFKLDLLKKLEIETLFIKTENHWKTLLKQKRSFELVIEATGDPSVYQKSIELTKHSGTLVLMGNISGDLKIKKEVVSSILRKEMQIRGAWNSDFNSEKQDDWKMALSVMKEGLNPSELITREVSLEELPIVLEKLYFHKERKEEVQIIKAMVTTF